MAELYTRYFVKKQDGCSHYVAYTTKAMLNAPVSVGRDNNFGYTEHYRVYVLGQDKLPPDVKDIRRYFFMPKKDVPSLMIAVKSDDGEVWYEGLDAIN